MHYVFLKMQYFALPHTDVNVNLPPRNTHGGNVLIMRYVKNIILVLVRLDVSVNLPTLHANAWWKHTNYTNAILFSTYRFQIIVDRVIM